MGEAPQEPTTPPEGEPPAGTPPEPDGNDTVEPKTDQDDAA